MSKIRLLAALLLAVIGAGVLSDAGNLLSPGNVAYAQTDLPSPDSITLDHEGGLDVVDGTESGTAVASWDATEGATVYRLQWFNWDAADIAANFFDQTWEHTLNSIDVSATDASTYSLTINRLKTGTLYAFRIGSISDSDSDPHWSEWVFLRLAGDKDVLDAQEVAQLQSAVQGIAGSASELAATASRPTNISMTRDYLRDERTRANDLANALDDHLEIIRNRGHDDRVDEIEDLIDLLSDNVDTIHGGRPDLLRELATSARIRNELVLRNSTLLWPLLAESMDDQQFDALLDHRDNDTEVSLQDFLVHSHTSLLNGSLGQAHTMLLLLALLQDPTNLARVQEGYESAEGRATTSLEYLKENNAISTRVIRIIEQTLGDARDEIGDTRGRLTLVSAESALRQDNTRIILALTSEIDAFTSEIQGMPVLPTPEPPAPGVPGVTDDEIMFGQSAALSGPSQALGEGMQLGILAAFEEANRNGGVHGRQLSLTTLDDRYETDFAFANTMRLIENYRVYGLIGAVGTPTSRAVSPLAHDLGVPFIGPFTGANFLRDEDLNNTLNVRASYHQETEAMVELLTEMDITRVAVLYQNDSYGRDGLQGVQQALDDHGMDVVASGIYQRNSTAVKRAAFDIAAANPEAVVIISSYLQAAEAIQTLRDDLDSDPIFMAVSFVGGNALADELGSDGEGVYVTQVVPLPDDDSVPVVESYLDALDEYDSGAEPGFVSLEGYIAGRLVIERLEDCGADVTRDCFLDVTGDSITIDIDGFELEYGPDDNQGSDEVFMTVINADGDLELAD
ncbi:MAG: ABC transporter substrate-binding protein [Chloroflexi bacterium]|nr:ABC transporter substrate-binding protein [Chloroflexota bacterium]